MRNEVLDVLLGASALEMRCGKHLKIRKPEYKRKKKKNKKWIIIRELDQGQSGNIIGENSSAYQGHRAKSSQ